MAPPTTATPRASKLTSASVLGPSPSRDLYLARIGSALTPRRVSQILSLADQGQPAQLHDLLNELRQKDAVLHSVLQTRETALLGCTWGVQAPVLSGKRKPTKRSEKIAGLCREWLGQIPEFERALAHLLDGIYKGYSVIEVTWAKRGKYLVPVGLHPIQGRRFAFDQEQHLRWYDDGLKPWPGDDVLRQYPYRFLVHQPRITGDTPTREGLGRILVWLSCFATWAWRDWVLFSELYGKPWRILTLDRATVTEEDEIAAERIVKDATSSTGVLLFENMKLDIKWPDATGGANASPSPAILDRTAQYMALATLGQLGTTGDVQNGLGGKGDAREKVRTDILHGDATALCNTMRWLLAAMVAVNFGAAEPVPAFTLATEDTGDTDKAAKTLATAKNELQLKIGEAHAYDVLGIPRPAPGEPCLGDSAPAAPAAPPDDSTDDGDEADPEPTPDDETTNDDAADD